MSEPDNRFRHLPPTKRRNGDLFEHFGVDVEPVAAGSVESLPVRTVDACPACGWYVEPGARCDHCGVGGEPA